MRKFYILLIFFTVSGSTRSLDHKIRTFAQNHKVLYELILANDICVFWINGGYPIGYSNYGKWLYATWRADPKRTILEKILFWDRGFFYDASNPPEEYPYPLLARH